MNKAMMIAAASVARRKTASGLTDPSTIAGLSFWYDASDDSTVFDAASGGSLPADGTVAYRLEDKSGNGRHLTNTRYTPLVRRTAVQNGLDVLRVQNAGSVVDILEWDAGSDAIDLSPVSFFFVAKLAAAASNTARVVSMRCSATGEHDYQAPNTIPLRNSTDAAYTSFGGAASPAPLAITDDVFFMFHSRQDGTTAHASVNRGAENSSTTAAVANMRYLGLGCAYASTGNPPDASVGGPCDIGEVLIYNAILTDKEIASVKNYLLNKWGL